MRAAGGGRGVPAVQFAAPFRSLARCGSPAPAANAGDRQGT